MSPIRRWSAIVGGALLVALSVGFFVVTTVRQDELLRDGVGATATVVGHKEPSAWNLFDLGRVIVRYSTPRGEFTRQIWLDDEANAPAGDTWSVVYDPADPGRVRSHTDTNTPSQWGMPFQFAGLAGVVLVIIGMLNGRARRPGIVRTPVGPGSSTRIPLRHYRLFPRPPYIDVDCGTVRICLPGCFGRDPFTVPAREVVVVDDAHLSQADDDGSEWVFERPLVIPYAATTSTNVPPNLTLFFTTPQRIPPLRWAGAMNLYMSRRESRSKTGILLDGIELRAYEPQAAVEALQSAGVQRVDRPNAWLRERNRVSHDPAVVAEVAAGERRRRWIGFAGGAVFLGLIGYQLFGGDEPSYSAVAVFGAIALTWLMPRWAKRRDRDRPE